MTSDDGISRDIDPTAGEGGSKPEVGGAKPAEYAVGYRKPPKHTQFQKGRSGNPAGRRKKQPSTQELIERELAKQLVLKVDGKKKRITKRELMVNQLVTSAIKGDIGALKLIERYDPVPVPVPQPERLVVRMKFDEEQNR